MLHCDVEVGEVVVVVGGVGSFTAHRQQTARLHGNAAPVGRSLSMVPKASRAQEGRKEAEGEGSRSCECCRQRKSAVSTCPDAVYSLKYVRSIFPFTVKACLNYNLFTMVIL